MSLAKIANIAKKRVGLFELGISEVQNSSLAVLARYIFFLLFAYAALSGRYIPHYHN
jgi:hypothetical protein